MTFFYDSDLTPVDATVETQTITVTATSYTIYDNTDSKTASDNFDLIFKDPCADDTVVTINDQAQTDPAAQVNYNSVDVIFNYVPFTTSPSLCTTQVACESVTGPSTISCVDIVTNTARMNLDADNYNNDVNNGQVIPGVYTFTYKVSVPESPGVFKTFTVDYTVNDPCDPPNSLAVPTLTDQSYVIGDTAATYVHADFVPVPAYCPFDISYTIESLINTNEPITVGDGD